MACSQISYATEQGIYFTEQGVFWREQRIFSTEQECKLTGLFRPAFGSETTKISAADEAFNGCSRSLWSIDYGHDRGPARLWR